MKILNSHGYNYSDNIREQLFELTPTGELRELPVPPLRLARTMQEAVDLIPGLAYSYLVGLGRQVSWQLNTNQDISELQPKNSSEEVVTLKEQLTFKLLEQVLTICVNNKWPVLALIVDVKGQRRIRLRAMFQQRHAPAIEIPDKNERPDLYYHVDGHWTATGHALAAHLIVQQLSAIW